MRRLWKYSFKLRCSVIVITTAQRHSTKKSCSRQRVGKNLWQWYRLEIRLNAFRRSTISQKQFVMVIGILIKIFSSNAKQQINNSIKSRSKTTLYHYIQIQEFLWLFAHDLVSVPFCHSKTSQYLFWHDQSIANGYWFSLWRHLRRGIFLIEIFRVHILHQIHE